ncbi:MAG: DUF1351 domain-containing protein [Eggerthellaceae bacterium]|nr:DUF1351 domain-containing protein [Eggerthellaceae bacterium]
MQPNYSKMTVAELKAECDRQGLEYTAKDRKADLVSILERFAGPIEVEAEVIEDSLERISYKPAVIDAASYLEAKRGWLEKMMAPYKDMDEKAILAMNVDEAKDCRADLNKIIKEVDDERKAIKNAYNQPLAAFEQAVKELLEPAKEDVDKLKQYIDSQEDIKRENIKQGLRATYEDFAPALVPVVPFERVLEINPKWLNLSYGPAKAARELEDAVAKIAKDWEVLKRQAPLMKFYEESEAVFFRTFDLNAAMEHNDMREAEQQRINAMKSDIAEIKAANEPVVPQFEEVEPEPDSYYQVDITPNPEAQNGYTASVSVVSDAQQSRPCIVFVDMTDAEKVELKTFLVQQNIGVRGERYVIDFEQEDRESVLKLVREMQGGGDD